MRLFNTKTYLTSNLLEEAAAILVKEKTVEADQIMEETVTGTRSITGEETVGMTLEVAAETPEVETETPEAETVAEILVVVEVQVSPSSTEVRDLQKDQVEAVDAAATINANRATIILADELICAAS